MLNLILPKFFFCLYLVSNYYSGYFGGSGTVGASASAPSFFSASPSAGSSFFFSSDFGGVGTVGGTGEALIGIFSSSVHS